MCVFQVLQHVETESQAITGTDGDIDSPSTSTQLTAVDSLSATPATLRTPTTKKVKTSNPRVDEAYAILKDSLKLDACSTYGEHVANELRQLSKTARVVAQHEINNILFQAAMGAYDGQCTAPTPADHGFITGLHHPSGTEVLANMDVAAIEIVNTEV